MSDVNDKEEGDSSGQRWRKWFKIGIGVVLVFLVFLLIATLTSKGSSPSLPSGTPTGSGTLQAAPKNSP